MLIHVVDVSGSEGRDPREDFDKINEELKQYSEKLIRKPQIVAANKIDLIGPDSPEYLQFKEYVEEKGYKVFPMSAPAKTGVREILSEAAEMLQKLDFEPEEEYEMFDFERDDMDEDYRKVSVEFDGTDFILSGKTAFENIQFHQFQRFGAH